MQLWQQIKKRIWFLIFIMALVAMAIDLSTRISTLSFMKQQHATLAANVAHLEATLEVAADEIGYARSDTAIEEWARVQGMMMQPGENIIIPLAGTQLVPTATPAPTVEPVQFENWQVWYALIFDQ